MYSLGGSVKYSLGAPTKYALISVFDKTGVVELASSLLRTGHRLISTGGTHTLLKGAGIEAIPVASLTKFPEILGGRVKTLHPAIFGGILADRNAHATDIERHGLLNISVVAVNLYPFWNVAPGTPDTDAIEEIDIGGVSLIRAAAKNFAHVSVLTRPEQYDGFCASAPDLVRRRRLAQAAFALTAEYDNRIARHFAAEQNHFSAVAIPDRFERTKSVDALPTEVSTDPARVVRTYTRFADLKYGCNPHQAPAAVYRIDGAPFPFRLLHGQWSYINVLDAINAWGLVSELGALFPGSVAAASFKHTSPAGAAIELPWEDLSGPSQTLLSTVYGLSGDTRSSVATYARARNADPQSSFGDFIGFSSIVDEDLATFIASQISDGIVARGFSERAIEILTAKKKGAFVIIEATPRRSFGTEFREIGGIALCQPENTAVVGRHEILRNVVTKTKTMPEDAVRDLMVANACMKFAQSNNVACAFEGQLVGLAAGQQSRIDAVKLMSKKVACWLTRHHPILIEAFTEADGPRQQRIMDTTRAAEAHGLNSLSWKPDLAFASDAFLPFADNIDELVRLPVRYITQTGGSVRDADVIEACDRHGMVMSLTGTRIFTH